MTQSKAGEITASAAGVPLGDAAFLRAVLEAIPAFVVRVDPDQRISYINHLRRGVTLQQTIGTPVREFIAPDDFEAYERAVEQALRTGEPCPYVARGSRSITERGAAFYACHAVPIDNGDGRSAICIVATDVSEHVARADALSQSEEKLRVAVEATGIGLWTWDLTNDRVEVNPRLVAMLGVVPRTATDYVERVVHPDDRDRLRREITEASAGKPVFPAHRIVRPNGEIRWLLPCGTVAMDETGRVVRMTGGLMDVTAQRQTEERLRGAQKLDAVGSLTAGVAHNFNNMLAVILPTLEASIAGAVPPAEMVEDALHAAHRARELVQQLMTFAGQRRSAAATHELGAIVERAVSMCRRTFESRVRVDAAITRTRRVACDPMAIEQLVVNLLINARDAVVEAGRAEPTIAVDVSDSDGPPPEFPRELGKRYLRIRIADNGTGMAGPVMERIFEPFFSTKAAGKGTGLGLATSYAIVRDHGGMIVPETEHGVGTTMTVFLPESSEARADLEAPSGLGVRSAHAGRILLVEDEPGIRNVARILLAERGHEIHVAEDGQSAVAALDSGLAPDLILLDRSLPGWPAKRTLDEIRKRIGSAPILFFTGQDVTSAERRDVEDVLYKPFSTEELVRAVERWLPRVG